MTLDQLRRLTILGLVLVGSLLLTWGLAGPGTQFAVVPPATPAERLVPTPEATRPAEPIHTPSPVELRTPVPATVMPPEGVAQERWRFGVVNRLGELLSYDLEALGAGWVVTGAGEGVEAPAGLPYVYIIPVRECAVMRSTAALEALVASNPAGVWQVGNEPDVIWQANCTPEGYAQVYHDVYQIVKRADPRAEVAAGSVSQPTPLRLAYLDRVLASYQERYGEPMPVDAWAVHNSVLREQRNSWGVEIPPGMTAALGQLVEVEDNDRLDLFQEQLEAFRVWMRDRGYRDRPLYLTEFSILMPSDFGYPPERVIGFMTGAFGFLLAATDQETGYPADGNRLVQWWAWYSVAALDYPTGNLFDPETKEMTEIGQAFSDYVQGE